MILPLHLRKALLGVNSNMVFTYVSGSHTDSSEKGRLMWARVKGKTENDLMKLPFKAEYNFRPGAMLPFAGQKNWKALYKFIVKIIKAISPEKCIDHAGSWAGNDQCGNRRLSEKRTGDSRH